MRINGTIRRSRAKMGGICSKSGGRDKGAGTGSANGGHDLDHYQNKKATVEHNVMAPPTVREVVERKIPEADDFYDGIPRFTGGMSLKSRSVRSTQAAVAKVTSKFMAFLRV